MCCNVKFLSSPYLATLLVGAELAPFPHADEKLFKGVGFNLITIAE